MFSPPSPLLLAITIYTHLHPLYTSLYTPQRLHVVTMVDEADRQTTSPSPSSSTQPSKTDQKHSKAGRTCDNCRKRKVRFGGLSERFLLVFQWDSRKIIQSSGLTTTVDQMHRRSERFRQTTLRWMSKIGIGVQTRLRQEETRKEKLVSLSSCHHGGASSPRLRA